MKKIENTRQQPLEIKEEPEFELPPFLKCGDKQFKFNDINKSWLFVQQKIASKLIAVNMAVGNAQDQQEMVANMFNPELDAGILALVYIELNEDKFKYETYIKRKNYLLDNLEYDEGLAVIKEYFFTYKLNSIVKDFQTYTKLNMVQPQH